MPTLAKILERRRVGPDGNELGPECYVFGNETGEVCSKDWVCAQWRRTLKRANITGLHLHDLRAEAGSQLLEAGVPLHHVRDALGHSNVTMTSTYLRSRTDALSDAYKRRDVHRRRQSMRLAQGGQSTPRAKAQ